MIELIASAAGESYREIIIDKGVLAEYIDNFNKLCEEQNINGKIILNFLYEGE